MSLAMTEPSTLIELLEERSVTHAAQRLFTFLEDEPGGEVSLTSDGLAERARRIAARLQAVASAGERAVLLYPPGVEYVAGFFGCLYSGCVAVPAYPPDPTRLERTLPRLRAIVEDSGATVVLTTSVIAEMAEFLTQDAPDLRALRWVATDGPELEHETGWRRPEVSAESLAFLQYTSGSTGTPKGVMLSHRNLLHNLGLIRGAFQTRADSVGVIWLPPYHDMGLIGGILVPLAQGFHTALMSPLAFLKRPRFWLEALTRFGGTISGGPNFAFELCTRRIPAAEREGLDLSRWEVAFCGAEPIRAETLQRFTDAFSPHGFRRESLYPCYGLAEATLIVTGGVKGEPPRLRRVDIQALEQGHAAPVLGEGRVLVGSGRTLSSQEVLVVDPETSRVRAQGDVGEIWVRGPSVARGYWRREETSAEVFQAHLASGEGPFLRTGDLGFLDAGMLYVTGRRKDLIILRGRNLYPQDLELAVEQSHPALRPGCGAAFALDLDGEERLVVVQEVDARKLEGAIDDVAGAIRQRLSEVHEVLPAALVLIEPGSLPKTSSGKVRRSATREAFLAGELRELHVWRAGRFESREAADALAEGELPSLESAVLARIAARLGSRVEALESDVPLTRYGLDSLAAVELAHGLERDLGVAIPMEALLRGVSAAELVREIAARRTSEPAREAIPRRPSGGVPPLSFAQQRLWFLERLEPGSAFYNVPVVARLAGRLDASALERGLRALMRRHEVLRMVIAEDAKGEPLARILESASLTLPLVDLSTAPEAAREAEVLRLAREEARRPFDLGQGPLLRATLLRLEPERHVLLLTLHHLVTDGGSMRVLVGELGELYAAALERRAAVLGEPPVQFGDYAVWQRQWLQGARLDALIAWWRDHLMGAPPVLELRGDRPRPAVQSYRGAQVRRRLELATWEQVRALARHGGATPFVTLLAGFQLLLHRYTGQEDLVVGVDAAHRARPELAGLLGLFVNQLPLRGDFSGAPNFREVLARLHDEALAAWAHQDLPFDELVRALNPERSLSHAPVFQVKLVLQEALPTSARLPGGLTLEGSLGDTGATKLDLTLCVTETASGVELLCEYATDLFDGDTVARMLRHLEMLLVGAVAEPERRVSELSLLTPEERQRALLEWSHTSPAAPARCAHHHVEAWARRTPGGPALTLGTRSWSYRELDARANQLAAHLRSVGVGPEVRVGVYLERTPELVVALLGVLKAGGAFLPLDTSYPPGRLAAMLDEARVPVLISQASLADELGTSGEMLVLLDVEASAIARFPESAPESAVSPGHLAYVLFTSGSTGTPKGALIEHRGLSNTAVAFGEALGLGPGRRILQLASFGFDASVCEVFTALCSGAELVFAPPGTLLAGSTLQEVLASQRIDALIATPTSLAQLSPSALPALGVVASVGEACTPELAAAWQAGRRFLDGYGPTEVSICATVELEVDPRRPSIGRALAGAGVYVLDREMQPVPVGVPGELCVGGIGVGRGYLNQPALTAERFVPHPFTRGAGERLYRTGDMVCQLADGRLEFVGRRDAQVKVRGIRIELGEVEAALSRHPGVRQAVVVPHERGGETRLTAYVVGEGDLEAGTLRRFLRERLPDAWVPSFFMRLAQLPLTPGGKVDRRSLPEHESVPVSLAPESVEPTTELERTIAAVWARVLQVPRVGVHDHFFEGLGGSSLTVVKASTQLRAELGREVPVTHFFEHPTVHALAARLERERAAPEPRAPRSSASEPRAEGEGRDIAIVGMAGRFPGAKDVKSFWENLRQGVESIARFSSEELEDSPLLSAAMREHPDFVPAGGVLDGADDFDAAFFEVSPREAEWMDPQQRLFLESAWHALEDAGYDAQRVLGAISLYAGAGSSGGHLLSLLGQTKKEPAALFEALGTTTGENVATKTAYKLKLSGESLNVYTACSTGLVAVHLACQSLRTRQSDVGLAGAVKVSLPQRTGYLFQEGMILSPDGHCRAFDARARGTVLGNGLGVVVLKRLADAVRDGDTVYAVIKGSALNNDADAKVSYTAPSIQGQREVISRALAAAQVDASTIGLVEAHGTGTSLGDPIEVAALTRAFRAHTEQRGYCALGSVKTNIGHLDTAAGMAGLIKAVLSLHHGEVPPSLHFEQPNPEADFSRGPFFVNTSLRPWPRGEVPRRAAVSSFGIGGTNAHLVLEEAPPPELPMGSSRGRQLVTLSARSEGALKSLGQELARHVLSHPDVDLADLAYTRALGRRAFEFRQCVVVEDGAELARVLAEPGRATQAVSNEVARARQVAFLFPGQGAQSVGMARDLYASEPAFRRALDACLEILPTVGLSEDLRAVLFPEPGDEGEAESRLREPRFALPALLAVEYALARTWMGFGIQPAALLGHSFGEYAAACLSGVLSLEDALLLAVLRGEWMSRLPPGGMLAVGMSVEALRPLLPEGVEIAAINAADRCTVSGPREALEHLERVLTERREGRVAIATAHAFHSRAVEPVMPLLEKAVAGLTLNAPSIPYISSLTGTWIRPGEATSPEYWARQMREPVRFSDGLATLVESGFRWFIEAGPDQHLTTLARPALRTQRDARVVPSLRRQGTSHSDEETLLESLGALWCAGAMVDWEGFFAHERRHRVSLPGYPFESRSVVRPVLTLPEVVSAPRVPPAPRGDIALRLTALWRERLGVEDIGPDDNFLALGGNSLMAAQLLTRLREEFRVQIPLSDLFEAPTVASLAARIENRLQVEAPEVARAGVSIAPIPRTGELPLSVVQARVWELERQEPGSSIFNEPLAVRIAGDLRVPLLERAFNDVIRRHESLRTVFRDVAGRAAPHVLPEVRISVPVVDLRDFVGDREAEAMRRARLDPAAPFSLDAGPLVRVHLLRLADVEHVLLLTIHHIVADTLSLVNFIREAVALYTGYVLGQPVELPTLSIQYIDFAAWQRQAVVDGSLASQQAYWRERLAGRPGPLPLPLDRPRVAGARRRGARHSFAFSRGLGTALEAFSQREGVTPYMTLLAGFKALLARCSGQDDIVVGTSIGNRTRPELEPQIGYVAHALALRTSLEGDPSFRELVLRVRDTTLSAFANPDVPYEQLLGELEPGAESGLSRLFDAVFLLHTQDVSAPILEFPGLRLSYFDVTELPAQYGTALADLTVLMRQDEQGFSGILEYAVDLFDAASIARMLSQMEALLTDAMASPDLAMSRLSLERPESGEALEAVSIPALLLERAEAAPEAVALREGSRSLTWRALRTQSLALAAMLRRHGVGPGVPVAVCVEDLLERAVALWGVLAAGGAYALVTPTQWSTVASLAVEGQPVVFVTGSGVRAPATLADVRVVRLPVSTDAVVSAAALPRVDPQGMASLVPERSGEDSARVVLSHQNLGHRFALLDARMSASPGELWLVTPELARDGAELETLWALTRGLQVVVAGAGVEERSGAGRSGGSRALDFSLFYFAADADAAGREKYQLLLDGARFADTHGFSAVWTPERHFHAFGGPYPSPTTTTAALAMITERVSLRAGSVVLPLHDAVRVAEEWSVIDNLSDGRAGVSFATGWNANDFIFAPENFKQRPEAVRRGVEEVRRLWRGGSIRRVNGAGVEVDVSIRPRPVQSELPLWITAAFNPETFRMAGELGTGLLTNVLGLGQDFEELARKVALYRAARRAAGHDRGHVVLMLHTFVTERREDVARLAREPLLRYFRSSVELLQGLVASQGLGFDVRQLSPQDLETLLEQGVTRYLEAGGLFGTPDSLAARMAQLQQADVDEVACLVDFGLPHGVAMEGLRHLDTLRRRVQGERPRPSSEPSREAVSPSVVDWLRPGSPVHLRCGSAFARTLANLPEAESRLESVRTWVVDEAEGVSVDLAASLQRAASARVVSPVPVLPHASETQGPRFVLDVSGRRAPVGVVGELFVGGEAVPMGFWNDPERSRARLLGAPDGSGARLYGTHVSARYRADGQVEVLASIARRPASLPAQGSGVSPAPAPVSRSVVPPRPVSQVPGPPRANEVASGAPGGAIRRVSRAGPLPLSFGQQRLWYLAQLDPTSIAYHSPISLRLSGALDVAALEQSLQELVVRHEVLRTVYRHAADAPVQHVFPSMTLPLEQVDLRHVPAARRETELLSALRERILQRFDLEQGPLMRATLLRLGEEEHVLLLVLHHIITDGWSGAVLSRELVMLYTARRMGAPARLPEPPLQYVDFALWQRGWLQGAELEAQLGWWKQALRGVNGALSLPTDFPLPAKPSGRGASQPVLVPRELTEQLKAVALREGGTLFMGLVAALQIVLGRYSGQEDITVGTPIAGRNRKELEGLLGLFVNTLVLRGDLSGDPSFRTFFGRVKRMALGAYANQDVPFEKLVEAMDVPRGQRRPPLFQVLVALQNVPVADVALPGMKVRLQPIPSLGAKFDLTLDVTETEDGLKGILEYSTDLFAASTVARMTEHFQRVLEWAVASPDVPLSELSLLTESERARVLVAWNDTAAEYPRDEQVHHLVEQQVAKTPES
ncbi:amino acid adenylation domain-containing protein, partial [Corallococcus sp. M34]|uniref:non-ribosomal peptide synthetase/type I polyketide synthase n=1 Tax=Citreicoccus inhibens TaxID=2849499 RepID=UPI001C2356B8